MESLENFAQGWGGPVSAYVRKVLFGASPRVKGEEKMPSPKVQVIDEKSIPIALKQLDQFEREQDAKVNGVNPMSRGVPKIPEGHSAKCTCLKCQKAKGWRG